MTDRHKQTEIQASSPLSAFIHRFIPGTDPRNKTVLLLLHGTGGNEDDLLDLGASLLPSAALLSPRGKISENGMPRFFRRLAEGVFDEEDLIFRTGELAEFVAAAAERYGFEKAHVVAVGYSNGANIAASLLLLHPGILKGALLLRAMVPLIPQTQPDLSGVRVFISAGEFDPIIPGPSAEKLAEMLRQAHAEVKLLWNPVGHQLTVEELDQARAWMAPWRAPVLEP